MSDVGGRKPYAARIRGERRVEVKTKVRSWTRLDLEVLLADAAIPETTLSQLLRRYILEGVTRDKKRAASET